MATNLLLSYHYHAKTNLKDVRRNLVCGRLMIDSGAFSAYTLGQKISLKEYAEYLQHWDGYWDHAITLDVIGDPKTSKRQTQKLHNMGLNVMPVFTRGESIKEFDAMVKDSGYVCVGGGVGMSQELVMKRVAHLQRRAENLGGGIHALGLGAIQALRRAKPYSADASNISGAFRFGSVLCFDGKKVASIPIKNKQKLLKYRDALVSQGVNVKQVAETGRMPGSGNGRVPLMQAMSLAYTSADEYLKQAATVPVPSTVADDPGTHLYSSIVGGHLLEPAAQLDYRLHHEPNYRPRIWQRYGRHHRCHPERKTP